MPTPVKHSSGYGKTGLAEVVVGATKIRCSFRDSDTTIDILRDDAPDFIRTGTQVLTLSSDNTKILYAKPVNVSVPVRFVRFVSDDANVPTLREVEARQGKKQTGAKWSIPAHLEGTALLEVTRGKWRGYILSINVSYTFVQYEQTDYMEVSGVMSSKTEEFMMRFGYDFMRDTIPLTDNAFATLQIILQDQAERGVEPIAIIDEKGWISKFAAPFEDADDEEEGDAHLRSIAKEVPDEVIVDTSDEMYAKAMEIVRSRESAPEPVKRPLKDKIDDLFPAPVDTTARIKELNEKSEPSIVLTPAPEPAPAPSPIEDQMLTILASLAKEKDASALAILRSRSQAGDAAAASILEEIGDVQ